MKSLFRFYENIFFVFFLFLLAKFSKQQCLLPVNGLCKFCSFSHYDSYLLDHFFSTAIFPPNNCSPTQNTTIFRNILVSNTKITANLSFDTTYYNFTEALFNESILVSSFSSATITLFLTKGQHYLFKTPPVFLFRRQNITLLLKPLYCAEFNLSVICCDIEKPKISIKSLNAVFAIANFLEIQNIDLDAIDANYINSQNETCFYTNSSCCDKKSLINSCKETT